MCNHDPTLNQTFKIVEPYCKAGEDDSTAQLLCEEVEINLSTADKLAPLLQTLGNRAT